MQLRPFDSADQDQIIHLISEVYHEYGERLCLENADSDLTDIEGKYLDSGGAFVVLDNRGTICGTHAVLPLDGRNGVFTIRRLYLEKQHRGRAWGDLLMDWALDWAKNSRQTRLEFWSDTRFTRAHHFFRRRGFQQNGQTRDMDDGWMPYQEYFFFLDLEEHK